MPASAIAQPVGRLAGEGHAEGISVALAARGYSARVYRRATSE